jgi:hypothetical protein
MWRKTVRSRGSRSLRRRVWLWLCKWLVVDRIVSRMNHRHCIEMVNKSLRRAEPLLPGSGTPVGDAEFMRSGGGGGVLASDPLLAFLNFGPAGPPRTFSSFLFLGFFPFRDSK